MSETPCGTMSTHNRFINSSEIATYLSVGAGVTFSSYLSVAGDTTLSSSLSVSNRVVFSSTLSVLGNTVLSSSLSVSNRTVLGSTLSVAGSTVLSSTLSVLGNTVLSSSLSVSNRTVLGSTLSVAALVEMSSHLSVAGSADITGRVYQATHMLVPPGSVVAYIASSAPGGWLLCDGSAISRTTYSILFGIIGTTYGSGDGSTTFTLPDMRGRVPVGYGSGAGLSARTMAATGGEETHTLTSDEMPSHNHNITDPGHAHSYVNNTNNQSTDNAFHTETVADDSDIGATTGTSTTGITINNTGGGQAHNNMQPFIVLNYIIKY